MHKTMKSVVRAGLLGFILLIVTASTSAAQKGKPAPAPSPIPIIATFSDLATDNVRSDGFPYDGFSVDDKGIAEGAYINSAGGIDINLVAGGSARRMTFQLVDPVGNPGDACYVPAGAYVAEVVDFRFNPYGSQTGILSMSLGATTSGFAAIVNFTPTPVLTNVVNGVTWIVSRLTLLYGAGSIEDPSGLTFTRNEANLWTLASTTRVPIQCMVSNGKRSVVYNPMDDGAFHHAVFSATMSLK